MDSRRLTAIRSSHVVVTYAAPRVRREPLRTERVGPSASGSCPPRRTVLHRLIPTGAVAARRVRRPIAIGARRTTSANERARRLHRDASFSSPRRTAAASPTYRTVAPRSSRSSHRYRMARLTEAVAVTVLYCPVEGWHNDALDLMELASIEAQEALHESEYGIYEAGKP